METINSISGGKTSAYMALQYPATYNIFSMVCVDNKKCGVDDPFLMGYAKRKLERYEDQYGEFVGTAEDPKIIKVLYDLEQRLGREIIWVRGKSFDEVIKKRKAIPNQAKRFCTTEMKMYPIFWYCYLNLDLPVKMNIGYRFGEENRISRFSTDIKVSLECEYRKNSKVHRWNYISWRIGNFPLHENEITHYDIKKFWEGKNIDWPADSNCQNCFWKNPQQLRKNWEENPAQMQWASDKEKEQGYTFKEDMSMLGIKSLGVQQDFIFGGGTGCSADGFCTD